MARERYQDIQQIEFDWWIPDAGFRWVDDVYKIVDRAGNLSGEEPPVLEPLRVREPGYKNRVVAFQFTKPLDEEPTLFQKFALLPPTREDILSFANRYGCIGMKTVAYLGKGDEPLYTSTLGTWTKEIGDMNRLLDLWSTILAATGESVVAGVSESDAIEALKKTTRLKKDGTPTDYIIEADEEFIQTVGVYDWKSYDVVSFAQRLAVLCVNYKLEGRVFPQIFFRADEPPVTRLVPDNLLAAMWLQFCLWITGEKRYKRCPVCGFWADTTGLRSDWKEHQECGSRRRARESYERRKAAAGNTKKGR